MLLPLLVELKVADPAVSVAFYVDVLGFDVAYERPEHGFVALRRGEVGLLLERVEPTDRVAVGELEPPFGRGVNLQIAVSDVAALERRCRAAGHTPMIALEDRWYRVDQNEVGNRQFWIQDPDGYLLRFAQDLGVRPAR